MVSSNAIIVSLSYQTVIPTRVSLYVPFKKNMYILDQYESVVWAIAT